MDKIPPAIAADEVFNSAMCFLVSYRFLTQSIRPKTDPKLTLATAMPQIAIAAFTIELFLKLFHVLDHGKCPRGHDLLNLFQNLKFETRQKIRRRWKERLPLYEKTRLAIENETGREMDTKLEHCIDLARQAFERYRYDFDTSEGPLPDFIISDLPQTLLDVAISRNPDWKDWYPKPPVGSTPTR
jgi:HEPN domain-containing protein